MKKIDQIAEDAARAADDVRAAMEADASPLQDGAGATPPQGTQVPRAASDGGSPPNVGAGEPSPTSTRDASSATSSKPSKPHAPRGR